MRSCNSYQDIKTPEELEEESEFESLVESMLSEYDPEEMGNYTTFKRGCYERARQIMKERSKEE